MPITKPCACGHLKILHAIRHGRNEGACSVAGCDCHRYEQAGAENLTRGEANRATIPPRLVEQARWQIKMHQRMIAELRQTFGIQE